MRVGEHACGLIAPQPGSGLSIGQTSASPARAKNSEFPRDMPSFKDSGAPRRFRAEAASADAALRGTACRGHD